eukprot:1071131-Pyramimonas_sp.AAC.1
MDPKPQYQETDPFRRKTSSFVMRRLQKRRSRSESLFSREASRHSAMSTYGWKCPAALGEYQSASLCDEMADKFRGNKSRCRADFFITGLNALGSNRQSRGAATSSFTTG